MRVLTPDLARFARMYLEDPDHLVWIWNTFVGVPLETGTACEVLNLGMRLAGQLPVRHRDVHAARRASRLRHRDRRLQRKPLRNVARTRPAPDRRGGKHVPRMYAKTLKHLNGSLERRLDKALDAAQLSRDGPPWTSRRAHRVKCAMHDNRGFRSARHSRPRMMPTESEPGFPPSSSRLAASDRFGRCRHAGRPAHAREHGLPSAVGDHSADRAGHGSVSRRCCRSTPTGLRTRRAACSRTCRSTRSRSAYWAAWRTSPRSPRSCPTIPTCR